MTEPFRPSQSVVGSAFAAFVLLAFDRCGCTRDLKRRSVTGARDHRFYEEGYSNQPQPTGSQSTLGLVDAVTPPRFCCMAPPETDRAGGPIPPVKSSAEADPSRRDGIDPQVYHDKNHLDYRFHQKAPNEVFSLGCL